MRHNTVLLPTALACLVGAALVFAGPLEPPAGPIGPTMRTLAEVEPRTPLTLATTPGDNDASPSHFRITQPGSYYLTGDLAAPAGKVAIEVACDNVSIDLGGFTVSGGLAGVFAYPADGVTIPMYNVSVSHGTIRGAKVFGVGLNLVDSARVEKVTTIACDWGIFVNDGALIRGCTARDGTEGFQAGGACTMEACTASGNAQNGIILLDNAGTLRGCIAQGNGWTGIGVGEGTTLSGCVATSNGHSGISALQDCVIAECAAKDNGQEGITTGHGCVVRHTTASTNGKSGITVTAGASIEGCTARENGEDGISAGWQCRIVGNTCMANGQAIAAGAGIRLASHGNRVEENVLAGNDKGLIVAGTDNFIVKNTARNNSVANFDVVAGNELAPVVSNPGTNNFSTATAWSNFAY